MGSRSLIDRSDSTSRSRKDDKPRTALILYGSETGNAQDVAEEVGRMAERLRFDTTVLDMDSVQLRDLLKPTVVIFALSTTGQGEMPQNCRVFWKTLLSGALKTGILRRLKFASFGLGDSSYARYNVAHRMLCNRMRQLGAQEFCERGEGNEQHPEGHSAGFREWIVALKESLLAVFPLPDGVEPVPDDLFLEPKWKLVPNTTVGHAMNTDVNGHSDALNGVKDQPRVDATPSREVLPIRNSYRAVLKANDRVTAPDHFQDVRLVDLRLNNTISYGPGAIAVVYPKNFPADVQDFINLMNWQDMADTPIALKPDTTDSSIKNHSLSPLRHLDLSNTTLTLRWLLSNTLDIMSIPRRSFFASLSHFANSSTEDSAYQKERLLELANPELIDELWDYTTRPKRTILEVMADFTSIKIPWQYALSVLPLMKGRQFSIASGGHLTRDGEGGGGTRVQLLVAIADPPSPIIKYRRRYGVCTRYIASLEAGQEIRIGLQPGYLDVRREELDFPVVMVGPGTGLAPMRALVWQRVLWARDAQNAQQAALERGMDSKKLAGDILLFGCRSEYGDFFFREEWEQLRRDEGLTLLTAFSRDRDKPRQYVQDQIRAHAGEIREAILGRKGKVYVCGSSGNMPKGVREALVDVLVEGGDGGAMVREDAEAYLDRMEKEGRYKQETW